LVAEGYDLDKIVSKVSNLVQVESSELWAAGKEPKRVEARSLLCYWAVRDLGISMDVGILTSDILICEPRQYAQNGEIVVALINNEEATVKRFFLRKDHIELLPENNAHPLMRYGFGEVLIQGKVIGVQRGPEQSS
jgi:hypothetical protein